jgi:hypothetical protein
MKYMPTQELLDSLPLFYGGQAYMRTLYMEDYQGVIESIKIDNFAFRIYFEWLCVKKHPKGKISRLESTWTLVESTPIDLRFINFEYVKFIPIDNWQVIKVIGHQKQTCLFFKKDDYKKLIPKPE